MAFHRKRNPQLHGSKPNLSMFMPWEKMIRSPKRRSHLLLQPQGAIG